MLLATPTKDANVHISGKLVSVPCFLHLSATFTRACVNATKVEHPFLKGSPKVFVDEMSRSKLRRVRADKKLC